MEAKCKVAKATFWKAGHVHGQVMQMPDITSTSRHRLQKLISKKWLKRTSQCRKTASYSELSHLCNQAEKWNQPLATCIWEQLNWQNQQPKHAKIQNLLCCTFTQKLWRNMLHISQKCCSRQSQGPWAIQHKWRLCLFQVWYSCWPQQKRCGAACPQLLINVSVAPETFISQLSMDAQPNLDI